MEQFSVAHLFDEDEEWNTAPHPSSSSMLNLSDLMIKTNLMHVKYIKQVMHSDFEQLMMTAWTLTNYVEPTVAHQQLLRSDGVIRVDAKLLCS